MITRKRKRKTRYKLQAKMRGRRFWLREKSPFETEQTIPYM